MVMSEGLFQLSVTWALPPTTRKPPGCSGGPGRSTTCSEAGPGPPAFTARISKAYWVPLVRPVTMWLVVPAPLPAMSPQVAVAGTVVPAP